jgi:Kef-type K+ transport system membrane component KefB
MSAGHASAELALNMLLVFGSAKVLGEIGVAMRLPYIVGQIVAGVLLGPGMLDLVKFSSIEALAELGVMFLLFRVGLEVKPSELIRVGRTAALVAVLGVIVPFGAGYLLYLASGAGQIESLFVGAALVATSIGITAQVLASKGLLHHAASRIILGAAVIDDILGLLVLAVVSSVAGGEVNVLQLLITAAMAIGFTVLILRVGSHAVGSVLPHVAERIRGGDPHFTIAMVLLFALAVLASYAGVAAIIGAFLAGVALSESVTHRVHDLAFGVTELLVPFFLAGIGLALDVRVLADGHVLLVATLILAAAIASKLLGCAAGARMLGAADSWLIGAGMVPRGEVGMVVAQIGSTLGIVTQQTYGVVVIMAVFTTIVAPFLLDYTFRGVAPEAGDGAHERLED